MHVDGILKLCSQRIFLLKQLRDQGMPLQQIHVILNRITYAIPVWGPRFSEDKGFFEEVLALWFHYKHL